MGSHIGGIRRDPVRLGTELEVLADLARLKEFCVAVLERMSVSRSDAEIVAEIMTRTDARGVRSHGTLALSSYCNEIEKGGTNPKARPELVHQNAAVAIVDGHAGLGMVVTHAATEIAISNARDNGVAVALVKNSNHFGAAGYYTLRCAEEGLIGICVSNAAPAMTVTGSRGRVLSNAPLAYGIPDHENGPIVLDIAMSVVAGQRLVMAASRGEQVPEGWLVDSEGQPTTDPTKLAAGALVPIAGHKGYGLALLVEVLAGTLSGAGMAWGVGHRVRNPSQPPNVGHAIIAISVDAAMDPGEFQRRITALRKEIREAPKMEGVDRIYVPGEIEAENEARVRAQGLIVDQIHWEALLTLAKRMELSDRLELARKAADGS